MASHNAQNDGAVSDIYDGHHPLPVIAFDQKFEAFPPAAKERLILKEVNTFVGNAIHLFNHHVTPILDLRRKQVVECGKTKRKFLKTAKQLW